MTRIQELEREIELTERLIRLRKELNSIPRVSEPYRQYYPYYPYYLNGSTVTGTTVGPNNSTSTWVSGSASGKATSGFSQTGLSKQVDGPGSYTVGYGG